MISCDFQFTTSSACCVFTQGTVECAYVCVLITQGWPCYRVDFKQGTTAVLSQVAWQENSPGPLLLAAFTLSK